MTPIRPILSALLLAGFAAGATAQNAPQGSTAGSAPVAPPQPQDDVSIDEAERWGSRMGGPRSPVDPGAAENRLPAQLAEVTPMELNWMPVVGVDGETVGRVERVARNLRSNALQLIVRTEDGDTMALEVDRVEMVEQQLRMRYPMAEGALQQQVAAFDANDFEPVPRDQTLAELTAAAPTG